VSKDKGSESSIDWAKAFAELEQEAKGGPPVGATPSPAVPSPAAANQTPAPDAAPRSRYEELCRTPSMKIEKGDLSVLTEFSRIIANVQQLSRHIDAMKGDYPDVLPERFYNTWADNMKETSMVMLKEFHAMRHGRQQKKYDARHVCSRCQSVFMMALPSDNVCDACRGAMAPRTGPY